MVILFIFSITAYYLFSIFYMFGHQRMPIVTIPKEIKDLEKEIQKETNSGDYTYFNNYPQHTVDNCNSKLNLNLQIDNDSIIKKGVELYVKSINNRVNKKCIDSLIINVFLDYSKEEIDSLRYKNYKYSFPIQ